jgi:hypothetical protein
MGVVRLLGKQQPDKQYRLTPITETAAQVTEVKGQKGKIAKQFVLGHISDDPLGQIEELTVAAKAGADGIVLITNRLDPKATGTDTFRGRLNWLMKHLPSDIPLGLYECPAPLPPPSLAVERLSSRSRSRPLATYWTLYL